MSPLARLVLLVATLATAFAVVTLTGVISAEGLRARLDPLGAAAPLAFVPVSVLLGLLLVPSAVLATASGLLFGAVVGALVSITAATINATLAVQIARRSGRQGVEELSGPRLRAVSASLERHGILAVVAARLAPGLPDGPTSYTAGLLGVSGRQIALGTLLGSAPRALSYAILGSTVADPTSGRALAGVIGLVITGLVGAVLAARVLGLSWRGRGPSGESAAASGKT